MTEHTPDMQRSRVNLRRLLTAHNQMSGEALMGAMVVFESEISFIVANVGRLLAEKMPPREFIPFLQSAVEHAITLAADDLIEINRRCLNLANDETRSEFTTHILAWLSIAEETRSVNMALFQSAILSGYAPNGQQIITSASQL